MLSGSNLSYYNTKGEREARDNMVLTAGSVVTELKTKGTYNIAPAHFTYTPDTAFIHYHHPHASWRTCPCMSHGGVRLGADG